MPSCLSTCFFVSLAESHGVCREQQQQQPATVASAALHQRAVLQNLDGSIRQMDRKLSKMQSRVLLCVEQYRGVRTSSDEARATMNNILSTHGTALAELQEQTNSLQKVVSSMQDVVVKQIQVCAPSASRLSLLPLSYVLCAKLLQGMFRYVNCIRSKA